MTFRCNRTQNAHICISRHTGSKIYEEYRETTKHCTYTQTHRRRAIMCGGFECRELEHKNHTQLTFLRTNACQLYERFIHLQSTYVQRTTKCQ